MTCRGWDLVTAVLAEMAPKPGNEVWVNLPAGEGRPLSSKFAKL